MYRKIVELIEQDIPLQDIANEFDLPIEQVCDILVDFYEFI